MKGARIVSSKPDSGRGASPWIGLDLAWSRRNGTGACALAPAARGAVQVAAFGDLRGDDEILGFVARHAARACVVGVDAPLVVPNESGARLCDRLLTSVFGRQGAGAYPANRRLLSFDGAGPRGEALGSALALQGWSWPPRRAGGGAREVHEVYPHAAWLRLFGLERRLAYKRKGRGDGLHREAYAQGLELLASLRAPRIAGFAAVRAQLDVSGAGPAEWKRREDRLDALLCALVAWRHAHGLCEALGDDAGGFVLVPAAPVKES